MNLVCRGEQDLYKACIGFVDLTLQRTNEPEIEEILRDGRLYDALCDISGLFENPTRETQDIKKMADKLISGYFSSDS